MSSPGTTRFLLALALCLSGCSRSAPQPAAVTDTPAPRRAGDDRARSRSRSPVAEDPLPPLATEAGLTDSLRAIIDRPFTGDLDEMEARRMIRVGVTFNRTHYFVDRGTQRGLSYEYLKQFETNLNAARRTGNFPVHVVFVPLPRDMLLPALTSGRVDAVAAQLTITPERQQLVDFSNPVRRNVSEVVVTAPGVPVVKSAEDLSGQRVFVRPSSSYADSLRTLNARLEREGRPRVEIVDAPEYLEDDDLLEMVNAGLVPMTVVDDYLADFWAQIFTAMTVNTTASLRTGGDLAVAFRKNSPKLAAEANAFVRTHGLGTVFGNTVTRRYLQSTQFAMRATTGADRERFLMQRDLFRKFSALYTLDYLLMMAKGYQESRLNQNARSPVGAIGVMQLMPATGQIAGRGRRPAAGAQHSRRGEIQPQADGRIPGERAARRSQPGADGVRVLQRRPHARATAAPGSGAPQPRPECVVWSGRADRGRAHRARDGLVRERHLQVLHRLPTVRGRRATPGRPPAAAGEAESLTT